MSRVGLICSSGGHLAQILTLRPWWEQHERFWVCFDKPDAVDLLADEQVYWAHWPTNRHLPNLARNTRLARWVLARERPDLLVSTGAGVALPFFWLGRAAGVELVWIEVFDRMDSASLTGRLVAPLCHRVILQWEEQRAHYPGGVVVGPLL